MSNLLCAIKTEEKSKIDNMENINYFKEIVISHSITEKVREEIDTVLYLRADLFIGDVTLVKTDKMISNEGRTLTGYKLRIELIINEFFKYSTVGNNGSIGIIRNNITKMVYIAMPEQYLDISIEDLYRKKRIVVGAYLEDMYCDRYREKVDSNLLILVNCKISE